MGEWSQTTLSWAAREQETALLKHRAAESYCSPETKKKIYIMRFLFVVKSGRMSEGWQISACAFISVVRRV